MRDDGNQRTLECSDLFDTPLVVQLLTELLFDLYSMLRIEEGIEDTIVVSMH